MTQINLYGIEKFKLETSTEEKIQAYLDSPKSGDDYDYLYSVPLEISELAEAMLSLHALGELTQSQVSVFYSLMTRIYEFEELDICEQDFNDGTFDEWAEL